MYFMFNYTLGMIVLKISLINSLVCAILIKIYELGHRVVKNLP